LVDLIQSTLADPLSPVPPKLSEDEDTFFEGGSLWVGLGEKEREMFLF
jgi:hypothetical protein